MFILNLMWSKIEFTFCSIKYNHMKVDLKFFFTKLNIVLEQFDIIALNFYIIFDIFKILIQLRYMEVKFSNCV